MVDALNREASRETGGPSEAKLAWVSVTFLPEAGVSPEGDYTPPTTRTMRPRCGRLDARSRRRCRSADGDGPLTRKSSNSGVPRYTRETRCPRGAGSAHAGADARRRRKARPPVDDRSGFHQGPPAQRSVVGGRQPGHNCRQGIGQRVKNRFGRASRGYQRHTKLAVLQAIFESRRGDSNP